MDFSKFPRRSYTTYTTPIEKLERLSGAFGGPEIYIKRDDMLGLAGGGNKTRKLEFLLADALAQGADTVLTCGAPQSNHCRLTLAAAMKEGLNCQLVLVQHGPGGYDAAANGNNLLFHLLGVEAVHVVDYPCNMQEELLKLADNLRGQGRKPYIIPMGGSNAVGALGYAACALELTQQLADMSLDISHIICTCGSYGTQAGLLTGLHALGSNIVVMGFAINHGKQEQALAVQQLAAETSTLLGLPSAPPLDTVTLFDEYVGAGYTIPSAEMVQAVKLLATTESILLDPIYTGKTMAGMLDLLRQGYFSATDKLLFLHTGGSPALYACADEFFTP